MKTKSLPTLLTALLLCAAVLSGCAPEASLQPASSLPTVADPTAAPETTTSAWATEPTQTQAPETTVSEPEEEPLYGIYIPELEDVDLAVMTDILARYEDQIWIDSNGTETLIVNDGVTVYYLYRNANSNWIYFWTGSVRTKIDYLETDGHTRMSKSVETFNEDDHRTAMHYECYSEEGNLYYQIDETFSWQNETEILTHQKTHRTPYYAEIVGTIYYPTDIEVTLVADSVYEYTRLDDGEVLEYGKYQKVDGQVYLLYRNDSFSEYTVTYNADMVLTKIVHSIPSIGEYGEYFFSETDPDDPIFVTMNWLQDGQLVTYTQETIPFGVTALARWNASVPNDVY